MLFSIDHTTEYRFNRTVFFEPHELRLQPRSSGSQRLLRFELQIEPTPAGVSHILDAEGNIVSLAWFNDLHDRLLLRTISEVETLRENPFDFLLTPQNRRLPVGYSSWELAQLAPALERVEVPEPLDPMRELGYQLRDCARGEVIQFLTRLVDTLYERFTVIHREEGDPWQPRTTIARREGACRDLAVLFIDICRSVGLASRFVSGYQEGDSDQDQRFMHAWSEVYLPGAGWRGFDPTHGLAVADRHVAVAASADPRHAAPVSATFRGSDVEATMQAEIAIETAPANVVC
jgi:transglutaminase-like putative cysteine protease